MTQAFNLSQLANYLNTAGQVDVTTGIVNVLPVLNGGTAANTVSGARTTLGLATTNAPTFAGATLTGALSGTSATFTTGLTTGNLNGGSFALRNRIINGNFGVNQRSVTGTVTLAAGVYGHDRWKAGASGCTYTFATSANVTTLTISAGSLQQVVEGLNLETGTYCLTWTGTATGKIGAGSLSASGVTGSITGGTNTTIEFSTGTLSKVQLEIGSATLFEQRPYGLELTLCQRYLPAALSANAVNSPVCNAFNSSATQSVPIYLFAVRPRVAPTGISIRAAGDFFINHPTTPVVCTALVFAAASLDAAQLTATVASGLTTNAGTNLYMTNASGFILFTGCEL